MAADKLGEDVENNMGPQMSGTVEFLRRDGFSQIRGTDGKIYRFHFGTCVGGIDAFDELEDGAKVTFNEFTRKDMTICGEDARNVDFGLAAVNVAIDTHEGTEVLWEKVSESVQFLVIEGNPVANPTVDDPRWSSAMPTSK